MIGQGVVNFGRILGPAAAALIMSFWVVILARQDLQITKLGRLPLFAFGMILTFNLGRDVTLLTLYPFVFGVMAVWWLERRSRPEAGEQPVAAAVNPSTSRVRRPSARPLVRRPVIRRPRVVVMRPRPLRPVVVIPPAGGDKPKSGVQ